MTKDIVGGLVILAFSIAYYLQSMTIRRSTMADEVGAHGLPQVYAIMLGLLALALVLKGGVAWWRAPDRAARTDTERATLRRSFLRMLGMLGIGVAYLIVLPWFGYSLSIALLLAAVILYQGQPPTWRVLAVVAGGTATLWAIFVLLLGIRLPSGVWTTWI